jgi:hypothetical protein
LVRDRDATASFVPVPFSRSHIFYFSCIVSLMEKEITAGNAIGDVMRRHAKHGEYYLEKVVDEAGMMHGTDNEQTGKSDLSLIEWMDNEVRRMIRSSAAKVCTMRQHRLLPTEADAEYQAVLSKGIFQDGKTASQKKTLVSSTREGKKKLGDIEVDNPTSPDPDQFFYFKATFGGLLLSFVDSEPSEIAVACFRDVQAAANWNSKRSEDAIAGIRVGWIQVDNHCPSASFPVAICPEMRAKDGGSSPTSSTDKELEGPFLTIQLSFAPKHSSGIAVSIFPATNRVFVIKFNKALIFFSFFFSVSGLSS